MSAALILHYDPALVEKTVFAALANHPRAAEFDGARQVIYEIADAEARDQAFQALHAKWFEELALGAPIADALGEQPLIGWNVAAGYIVCAIQAKQEGAELYVNDNDASALRRTLRLTLRPTTLVDGAALQPFLRHELFHIADMLDGEFAYQPELPKSPDGPSYDNFITNRYRVLWDTTIHGRMARRGWLCPASREQMLGEFAAAFPMWGAAHERFFEKIYGAERPCHAELARLASDPAAADDDAPPAGARQSHCALCRFPTHAFEPAPEKLADEVRAAIIQDFPRWLPELGLCTQCADLYRGRQMSLAALRTLPGWHPELG